MAEWQCKVCSKPQHSAAVPVNLLCTEHDTLTRLPCAVCARATKVSPADICKSRRPKKAVHLDCVLIDDERIEDAQLPDVRGGDADSPEPGGWREGGRGAPGNQRDRQRSLAGDRLGDRSTDSGGPEPELAGAGHGDAPASVPGTEAALIASGQVQLMDKGSVVAFSDRVRVVDGEGFGLEGDVVQIRKSAFGHVTVVMRTDDDVLITTLEDKVKIL